MKLTETEQEQIKAEFIEAMKVEGKAKEMLISLIKNNLVPIKVMRDFLICKGYERILKENQNHVTKTLYDLSDRYNLCERQARDIYYNNFRKFIRL